jgi:hypothetical protein
MLVSLVFVSLKSLGSSFLTLPNQSVIDQQSRVCVGSPFNGHAVSGLLNVLGLKSHFADREVEAESLRHPQATLALLLPR